MNVSDQLINCYLEIERNYLNGHLEAAEELSDQLVKQQPQNPHLRLLRGHIYYSLGELKKARYEYELTRGLTADEDLIEQSLNGLERCDSLHPDRAASSSDATIIFPSHAVIAASSLEQSFLKNRVEEETRDYQLTTQNADEPSLSSFSTPTSDTASVIQVVSDDEIPEDLHLLQADELQIGRAHV